MQPFADLVTSPGWRRDAEAWIAAAAAERGWRASGPVEQPRVRPWSTQMVVPTDGGRLWFKANCDALAFEPRLQATLAGLVPELVDEPVAVDGERGWLLTGDRGPTLADAHELTLDDWTRVVTLWAALQRRVAEHRDAVLSAGVADCSPPTVAARLERMVRLLSGLPDGHPARLDARGAAALRAVRGRVERAAAVLGDSPFPVSLQHGDLHPGNVFAVDGHLRIFDFGDAQWAHALEAMVVPRRVVEHHGAHEWRPIARAYLAAWGDPVAADELDELFDRAAVTQLVNRSLTWWGAVAQSTPEELARWGSAPREWLEELLEV